MKSCSNKGYFIISVEDVTAGAPVVTSKVPIAKSKKSRKFSHKKTTLSDLITFSRQLATMLEAGVTLVRSLDVIHTQIQSEQLFKVMGEVKKDVEQGHALSVSLAKHSNVFNQFWVSLIEVGEASGTIPVVLNKLCFYLEQQSKFKSTIISGIIYPAILFCVCMGAVAFFALFVGPRFEAIFVSMNADLPTITVILLVTFKFIKQKFFLLLISAGVVIFLLGRYLKTYAGKSMFEKFMFNMPTVGGIYKLIVCERFASQMAILLDAGVPILYALDISERLVDNNTCANIICGIKDGVKEGELLVAPMERSGFFSCNGNTDDHGR